MGVKDSMKRKNNVGEQFASNSMENNISAKISRQNEEIMAQNQGNVPKPPVPGRNNTAKSSSVDEGRGESQDKMRIQKPTVSNEDIRDDYENREENPLLNQIEYIWSGISYTSSQSSAATIDMKDRHYMVKRKKEDPEEDSDFEDVADEAAVAIPMGTCSPFTDCLSPRKQEEHKQRQRTVQFLSPLVTDVQTSYRVPNHEKHKFFYTANNIKFFREEYEYESQPSCAASITDFFSEHYDNLCSVSIPKDQQNSPVCARRLKLDAKKLAEQTKENETSNTRLRS